MSSTRIPQPRPDWHQACLDAVSRDPVTFDRALDALDTLTWINSAGGHVRAKSIGRATVAAYSYASGEGPERASITLRRGRRLHLFTLPEALADGLEPDFAEFARALGLDSAR